MDSNLILQYFKNIFEYLLVSYLFLKILILDRSIITYLHYSIICVCVHMTCMLQNSINLTINKPLNEEYNYFIILIFFH